MSVVDINADRIVHSEDLGFTIVVVAHEYYVDYTIYDIVAWEEEPRGIYNVPVWCRPDDSGTDEHVYSLDLATPYLTGHVKWDGCSNWHFDEQDRCALHGCSRADIKRLGDVMALCWDMTKELCPMWHEPTRRSKRNT